MGGPFRLVLGVLVIVAVAGLSLACADDSPTPLTNAPAAPSSSTEQPVALPSADASEPPHREATATTASPAPTVTQSSATSSEDSAMHVTPQRDESGGGPLRVITSRSVAIPSSSGTSLLLYGSPASPGLDHQSVPVPGGLTVSAIGVVTVAAEEAYVVIVPEQVYGPSGLEQMTDGDRQDIRDEMAEIGIPEEDVEFSTLARYGPSAISVEVTLDQLTEKRNLIVDAAEEVIRRSESYGVIYALSDEHCEGVVSLARREAIPAAERAADDLAEGLGVDRGAVTRALEYPLANLAYGFASTGIRSCGAQSTAPYPNLVPFDAEPEVEVTVGLQITYAIR